MPPLFLVTKFKIHCWGMKIPNKAWFVFPISNSNPTCTLWNRPTFVKSRSFETVWKLFLTRFHIILCFKYAFLSVNRNQILWIKKLLHHLPQSASWTTLFYNLQLFSTIAGFPLSVHVQTRKACYLSSCRRISRALHLQWRHLRRQCHSKPTETRGLSD